MNKYHIRIDGEQSSNSYTYQELVDMGIFELDEDDLNGIEVKKTTNKIFKPIKSFCFPECSYYVDEYGQIHRKNTNSSNVNNGMYVDEFGQIIRPNVPNGSSSTSSSSSSSSNSTSTSSRGSSSASSTPSSSNTSSNSDGWETWETIWRIVATIFALAGILLSWLS